jgi:hypothetical protein
MKRQGEVESLGIQFTEEQMKMMWEMSDKRRLPSKTDLEVSTQRQRLITYASLLDPIRARYGDLTSPKARAAIPVVFGLHKNNIP